VRFQVLTATSINTTALWDKGLCNFIYVDRRFRGAFCRRNQGDEWPDDGGCPHIWNVCLLNETTRRLIQMAVFFNINLLEILKLRILGQYPNVSTKVLHAFTCHYDLKVIFSLWLYSSYLHTDIHNHRRMDRTAMGTLKLILRIRSLMLIHSVSPKVLYCQLRNVVFGLSSDITLTLQKVDVYLRVLVWGFHMMKTTILLFCVMTPWKLRRYISRTGWYRLASSRRRRNPKEQQRRKSWYWVQECWSSW
jgi:hypothetical protein